MTAPADCPARAGRLVCRGDTTEGRRHEDLVAGATGVLGRRLVPLLVEGGHQVTAMARSTGKAAGLKTEDDPLDPDPPAELRPTLDAIRHLESAVLGAEGIEGAVLRYGGFYGPGTWAGDGGFMLDDLRRRRFPVVGDGAGVWSFVHIDDAATATVAAVERGAPGSYQIVDDDPASAGAPPTRAGATASPPP